MRADAAIERCRSEIETAVANAIKRLAEETGITPSGVSIDMLDVTVTGQLPRVHVSGAVRLHFDL
jgi:hypothetical protein